MAQLAVLPGSSGSKIRIRCSSACVAVTVRSFAVSLDPALLLPLSVPAGRRLTDLQSAKRGATLLQEGRSCGLLGSSPQ